MDCRECGSLLAGYALGELAGDVASEVREHLDGCPACRGELSRNSCLIGMMRDEPEASPTARESATLAEALARVKLPRQPAQRVDDAAPQGLPGFAAACALAFAVIASLLSLAAFGWVDVRAVTSEIGPCTLVGVAVVVVIITSFVPIAVTARRRPLNGMTFRR